MKRKTIALTEIKKEELMMQRVMLLMKKRMVTLVKTEKEVLMVPRVM